MGLLYLPDGILTLIMSETRLSPTGEDPACLHADNASVYLSLFDPMSARDMLIYA